MRVQENSASLDTIFNTFESRTNLEKGLRDQRIKREYRLDRMTALCKAFGNPQHAYGVIHIAGSKGKGSTAAYIAALMKEANHRVGTYSSPHLVDYRERFRLEGEVFPEKQALKTAQDIMFRLPKIEPYLAGESPATTFELLTLFGFILFRNLGCDIVILECGLGGRLDATNVVDHPKAVVLTPIEMEHVDILGPGLVDIAREKAGILKARSVAWTAHQIPAVLEVLRQKAQELGIILHELGSKLIDIHETHAQGFRWLLEWHHRSRETVELSMGGRFQAKNAALALVVVRSLESPFSGDAPRVLKDVTLPGRFQIVSHHPLIVLDGAHTSESVLGVLKAFFSLMESDADSLLLFGSVMGKNHADMARILCGGEHHRFENVIISTPGTFKPSDPVAVARSFQRTGARVKLILDPMEAWKNAMDNAGENRSILVTGSFYMAGEIAKIIQKRVARFPGSPL